MSQKDKSETSVQENLKQLPNDSTAADIDTICSPLRGINGPHGANAVQSLAGSHGVAKKPSGSANL